MNLKTILYFAIGPIGAALLGIVTVPVVTWYFSAEDIGRLGILQVVINFGVIFLCLGLDQSYVREFHQSNDKHSLLKTASLAGLTLLIAVLVLTTILPINISKIIFDIDSDYLSILALTSLVLSYVALYSRLILRLENRALEYSLSQIVPKALYLMLIVIIPLVKINIDFEKLALVYTLSLSMGLLIAFVPTWKTWLSAGAAGYMNWSLLIGMLRYGLPLVGGGLAFWGLSSMTRVLLKTWSNFDELGIYVVATNFAGAAFVLQAVFSVLWGPVVYRWTADNVDIKRIIKIFDFLTLLAILLWSSTGVISFLVTYLLPQKYEDVQYLLVIAMAHPLLYTLSEATGIGITVKRKSIYSLYTSLFVLLVNIILNYLLIPTFGAKGAVVATALTFWLFFVLRTEVACRLWFPFPRYAIYFFVTLSIVISIINLYIENLWWSSVLWVGVLVAVVINYKNYLVELIGLAMKRLFKVC